MKELKISLYITVN